MHWDVMTCPLPARTNDISLCWPRLAAEVERLQPIAQRTADLESQLEAYKEEVAMIRSTDSVPSADEASSLPCFLAPTPESKAAALVGKICMNVGFDDTEESNAINGHTHGELDFQHGQLPFIVSPLNCFRDGFVDASTDLGSFADCFSERGQS